MAELSECVDGLPNLCGSEPLIEATVAAGRDRLVFGAQTPVDISGIDSAIEVALHMHQPLIPAGGPDLRTAAIVGNLQRTPVRAAHHPAEPATSRHYHPWRYDQQRTRGARRWAPSGLPQDHRPSRTHGHV